MTVDQTAAELRAYEQQQDRAYALGDEFCRELRMRLRDDEYRRDALAAVLRDDDEAFLLVWALMTSERGFLSNRTEVCALNRLVDRQIERHLDLEYARGANEADE